MTASPVAPAPASPDRVSRGPLRPRPPTPQPRTVRRPKPDPDLRRPRPSALAVRTITALATLAAPAWVAPGSAAGQAAPADSAGARVDAALARPEVRDALERVDGRRDEAARLLARIGGIVSPSGREHDRARAVADRMREIGLDSVRVTDTPNVVGVLPGRSPRAVVFVATLDDLATVAEHQRAAKRPPRVRGDRVVGPGTNTSLTTVALLTAAQAYLDGGLTPERTLVFAGVAREETGLMGMKALYREYRGRADVFVDVLGDGHSISYGALGIHWWRAVAHGPPGHTLRGGLPNVNQAIARAVDRVLSLPAAGRTDDSRTRLNVAVLRSGAVFNHKPDSGWFSLDIRSMEADTLAAIEARVEEILETVSRETEIRMELRPHHQIPGGQIAGARRSEPVRAAAAVSRWLGYEPELSNSGSSNMNVAVAGGTPAIGLGGSRGGNRGRPTEWADVDALVRTARHVLMLAVLLGGEG